MRAQFLSRLPPVTILDGGLATALERRGHVLDTSLWSAHCLAKPDSLQGIYNVHYDFLRSGADIIITSSYQATCSNFERELGVTKECAAELMRKSLSIAVSARDDFWSMYKNMKSPQWQKRQKPLVAMSIGCYGASFGDGSEYTGDYGDHTVLDLEKLHSARFSVLLSDGQEPDVLACETIPNLIEAKALVATLPKHIPAWVSFCCKDGSHVSSGEALEDCVREVCKSENVVAIGVNCTNPKFVSENLVLIGRTINSCVREGDVKPALLCYPNSGEKWDSKNKTWFLEKNDVLEQKWIEYSIAWYQAGARMIGGCCRAYPEHISLIRETLEKKVHRL